MSSASKAPFAPARCWADAMNQFGEYSLSPPRGPDCWMSDTNAVPMNMTFQLLSCVISMDIGSDAGLADVPEASPMRYMPASFMSAIPCWLWAVRGLMAHRVTPRTQLRRSFISQDMTLLTHLYRDLVSATIGERLRCAEVQTKGWSNQVETGLLSSAFVRGRHQGWPPAKEQLYHCRRARALRVAPRSMATPAARQRNAHTVRVFRSRNWSADGREEYPWTPTRRKTPRTGLGRAPAPG